MSKQKKDQRPTPRLPRGLRDIEATELRQQQAMLSKIREVYERYGFEPLETPVFEYTDALGKFLPDQDRPNAGVFSLQDEDEQWMSLRYDLTAPLARYVAQHFQFLPKPFRRYAVGSVFRNEKPGPGRFRQFTQFDADTVGAESVAADAEMLMLAADTLEALGLKGNYVIKVNNRKILDGYREAVGLDGHHNDARWLIVMRALDKFDRLGREGVELLLGKGRKDESGDFTPGAELDDASILRLGQLLTLRGHANFQQAGPAAKFNPLLSTGAHDALVERTLTSTIASALRHHVEKVQHRDLREIAVLEAGLQEIEGIGSILDAAGYDDGRVIFDPSVVRGLEYYTGPVFEAELTFEVKDEKGNPVRFGSVGGGGRYDDLVSRFTGQKVPATGFSIGVSRLQAALLALHKDKEAAPDGPVIVTVMEKERLPDYQRMVQDLRGAGIRAELYLGNPKKFGKQLEYADKRNSPCVVIQGSDEYAAGQVTLKDLVEGAKAAAAIKDNKEWKEQRPAQVTVPATDLITEVRKILARHTG
ncbi:Histidine--tRNA ligase [Hyphomicrobium sp. 1Nfss2.1]|uniref:histidine--tRNA ligase n=1 Tax=Hyphomicrobium sp. 1Nfss2.1 TaxID=3413936 RepID=UPI003C7E27A1